MIRSTLLLAVLPIAALPAIFSSAPAPEPTPEPTPEPAPTIAPAPVSAPAALPFHCQVPCGVYGDTMRIGMLMEDAATIEKGMKTIMDLEKAGTPMNQLVRWVTTKDAHAQSIQDTVAAYWLTQRIKAPKDTDEAAWAKYHKQLELMHGITVAAMKCKQTTDAAHVGKLRKLAMDFATTYFEEDVVKELKKLHHDH